MILGFLITIVVLLLILIIGVYRLMPAIDDLTAAVVQIETGAAAALNKLAALKASGVDPVAVEALVARLNTVAANLTAAAQ